MLNWKSIKRLEVCKLTTLILGVSREDSTGYLMHSRREAGFERRDRVNTIHRTSNGAPLLLKSNYGTFLHSCAGTTVSQRSHVTCAKFPHSSTTPTSLTWIRTLLLTLNRGVQNDDKTQKNGLNSNRKYLCHLKGMLSSVACIISSRRHLTLV